MFLTDWCEILATLRGVDLIIAYTPTEARSDLQTLIGDHATYTPQIGTDLGERLASATQWATEQGYTKILLVGSDSPTLPISYISKASTLLDSRDIVVGPSTDGGYYLIGFSATNIAMTVPFIFEGIAWSTADVFQQTVASIRSLKVTFGLLPPWYDIDTADDLAFLHAHISAMRLSGETVQAVRTESLLTELLS
jgi:rSAM/selenodomain-associated transferase 1